ncbi:MAG: OFA family MFS transporter [Nitrospirae bacterium]|nr:OFA family MFS transporter [Nitrospirota bacterium]MCL5978265.1 OFA family MFS transporter [Nitrospirota bacterium]
MSKENASHGIIVTAAGTGINLALGVLYAWSIFKGAIKEAVEKGGPGAFTWDIASLNDPYAICCLVFAITMIAAGKCQDIIGPRKTAFIGGLLVGLGFIWASQTTDYLSWILGFGVLTGAGIAFGYSSATPAALKWFPPNKTGRIAGIVVSGFGLASVYIAPLSQYLLVQFGVQKAMLFYGIAFPVVVGVLSFFLVNPPSGYVPPGFIERRTNNETRSKVHPVFADVNATPLEMIKSHMFWILWILFFIGASAGLMVIGSMAGMAKTSMGEKAFLAVAILAMGNAGGRIAAGTLSDKIGRKKTLIAIFAVQAVLMFAAIPATSKGASNAFQIVFLATLIGFNYGANLALFPSYTKDLWGIKNFGVNYGIVFTAWGIGGLIMSRISQSLIAVTGDYNSAFMLAGGLLLAGTVIAAAMRDKKEEMRRELKGQLLVEKAQA